MAGWFNPLTHPPAGKVNTFMVAVNDEQQWVVTHVGSDGTPIDFCTGAELTELAELIAEQSHEKCFCRLECHAEDEELCETLLHVPTWHDACEVLNGKDCREKWVMYGRWYAYNLWRYLSKKQPDVFAVTERGVELDSMRYAREAEVK